MKVYRGAAAGARDYLEAGRCRADDYYLSREDGIARRYIAGADQPVRELASLSGDGYEGWVAGLDPDTGTPRGRLRQDANAVRFVEVVVNGPKSWSLAAELHNDIAAAYEAAQDRAAEQLIGWLARTVTTRVGPRGAQLAVPVDRLEAAVVRHYTSRAGDPHRHLHLQVNARVFAAGKWRGLDTVAVRDALAAVNGIGHAAIVCDPGFRAALARHGYTLTGDGEIAQLAPYVGAFSKRAGQIGRHLDRYERDWRAEHPGEEPGPVLRRGWDARAWADGRADKGRPVAGAELTARWVNELSRLGYRDRNQPVALTGVPVAAVDRDLLAGQVIAEVGAARSAWNAADLRGAVEQHLATLGVLADPAARGELAEDVTARAAARCVPLLDRAGLPAHIRALTSQHVLDVEADLVGRLAGRAADPGRDLDLDLDAITAQNSTLDAGQAAAVAVLAGDRALVVVEGAAGAGKTTTLAAARDQLTQHGRRMVVVTPTLRAAQVVEAEIGAAASSAAKLAYAHGWRWDERGVWTRLAAGEVDPATGATFAGPAEDLRLHAGDVLVVDEAGMLDQDTALVLLTLADESGARVALVGDRHQLPAVGRGGVLDHAARWADPVGLDVVHRFVRTSETPVGRWITVPDTEYAQLSRAMRAGDYPAGVYTALDRRGQIARHADAAALHETIAKAVLADRAAGRRTVVVAATREQVAQANQVIRDALVAAGHVDDRGAVTTRAGERIGAGDQVATRRNDRDLDVANREVWTVTAVTRDGGLRVRGTAGERLLPAGYVAGDAELAYASTVHGAQGMTVDHAHVIVDEHTTAASAYVGLTRGRHANTAHLVARDDADARDQWSLVFARERADLGPAHARDTAAREAARYAPPRPLVEVLAEMRQAWIARADAAAQLARLRPALVRAEAAGPERARIQDAIADAKDRLDSARQEFDTARQRLAATEQAIAQATEQTAGQLRAAWDTERPAADAAARRIQAGVGRFGRGRRDVQTAQQQLAAWTQRWQPILDRLPPRIAEPAALATGWHSTAVADALHAHAADTAADAHPDPGDQRQELDRARTSYERAREQHTSLDQQAYRLHESQPEGVTALRDLVAAAEHTHTTAGDKLTALLSEPALANHPDPRRLVAGEIAAWRNERYLARAAERIDRLGVDSGRSIRRHKPDHDLQYGIEQHLDHGPSIGM